MLIHERMIKSVITIAKNDTIETAMKTMRDKGIRHLPVVEGGKPVGMLSLSDIRRAMPSSVSTLDAHEATYLFDRVKVRDAIPRDQKIITIREDDFIEEAALLMRAYKIGSLPVVDAGGMLVGIITESNIFDAFVELLGVRSTGGRIAVNMENKPGQLAAITGVISKQGVEIERIAMFPIAGGQSFQAVIRLDIEDVKPIAEMLRMSGFAVQDAKNYSANFAD